MVTTEAKSRYAIRQFDDGGLFLAVWPSLTEGEVLRVLELLLRLYPGRSVIVAGMSEAVPEVPS